MSPSQYYIDDNPLSGLELISMVLLFQIIDTLNRILQLYKSIEVRRAAVLVIGLILKGLGSDAFRVLESALRDIWYKPRLLTFAPALPVAPGNLLLSSACDIHGCLIVKALIIKSLAFFLFSKKTF